MLLRETQGLADSTRKEEHVRSRKHEDLAKTANNMRSTGVPLTTRPMRRQEIFQEFQLQSTYADIQQHLDLTCDPYDPSLALSPPTRNLPVLHSDYTVIIQ